MCTASITIVHGLKVSVVDFTIQMKSEAHYNNARAHAHTPFNARAYGRVLVHSSLKFVYSLKRFGYSVFYTSSFTRVHMPPAASTPPVITEQHETV
jgi:hypothetical protein